MQRLYKDFFPNQLVAYCLLSLSNDTEGWALKTFPANKSTVFFVSGYAVDASRGKCSLDSGLVLGSVRQCWAMLGNVGQGSTEHARNNLHKINRLVKFLLREASRYLGTNYAFFENSLKKTQYSSEYSIELFIHKKWGKLFKIPKRGQNMASGPPEAPV